MYDATFTGWWQWAVDLLLQTASQKLSVAEGKNVSLPETETYLQSKLATSICSTAQKYCVGPQLQQYQNASQCYSYLTTQTRFGEAYELGMYFFPFLYQNDIDEGLRPQYRPLPHGPPEHGAHPPRGPLPAHRPLRRRILRRHALVR